MTTGSTIPIDVVQLSAQTGNAFARYSRTGDDKLGLCVSAAASGVQLSDNPVAPPTAIGATLEFAGGDVMVTTSPGARESHGATRR